MVEAQARVRQDRRARGERHPRAQVHDRAAVDAFDVQQREVLLAAARLPHGAGQLVAWLEVEPAHLARTHVDVFGARLVVVAHRTQEAKTVGQDLEHPFVPTNRLLAKVPLAEPMLQDLDDELAALEVGQYVETFGMREIQELGARQRLQSLEVAAVGFGGGGNAGLFFGRQFVRRQRVVVTGV